MQYDLMEFLQEFKANAEEKELSPFEYLKKGDRILTLLREKEHVSREIPFFEAVNMKKYYQLTTAEKWDALKKAATKLINPVMEKIDAGTCAATEFDALFEEGIITSEIVDDEECTGYRMIKHSINAGTCKNVLKVMVKGEKEPYYVPCGNARISKSKDGQAWYFRTNKKDSVKIANASFFAGLAAYRAIKEKVQEEVLTDDSRVREWLEENHEYYKKRAVRRVKPYLFEWENTCLPDTDTVFGIKTAVFPTYKEAGYDTDNHILREWFLPYMLLHGLELGCCREQIGVGRSHRIELNPVCHNPFMLTFLFGQCLQPLYESDMEEEKNRKKSQSSYAKSFMTKKNIPERVLKAMQNSKFNEYFEYVEMDEDTDIEKVEALAREFEAFAEFFCFGKESVDLRFRKLGNHKAAGLYYPGLKCLCVDIRHPDSFAHEYFHLLDYEKGRLSRKASFSRVLDKYSTLVKKAAEDKGVEAVLKGKYDLHYYLHPSEVFARCGELYLQEVLGFSFSMLKPQDNESFAYPKDMELLEMIASYYDCLLNIDRRMAQGGFYG